MTSSKKKKPPSKRSLNTRSLNTRSLNTRSLNTRSLRAATGRLITWGFLLCVAASLVLANWPLQYAEILRSQVGTTDDVIDYTPTDSPMPIMAGWPLRYSIAYDDESVAATAEGASATRFSIRALGVNFAVAIAILGLLAGYLYRRKMLGTRSRSEAEDGNGNDQAQRSRLSIADLLFVTMLLAIPLGMKVRLDRITEQEKAFARTISVAGGRADLSAWLPEILADRLPANLRAACVRFRGAQIESPSQDLLASVLAKRELTKLRIGGGDYDLRLLAELPANIHLTDLRIGGRNLSPEIIETVANLPRLQTLNLTRTNVTLEMLEPLGRLSHLASLSLIRTQVLGGDFSRAAFSSTVENLALPLPDVDQLDVDQASTRQTGSSDSNANGEGDMPGARNQYRVAIKSWPKLKNFYCFDYDSQSNSKPLSVELEDLPQLETAGFDSFQKIDLIVRNTPKLTSLPDSTFHRQYRTPSGTQLPGSLWLRRVDIVDAPQLPAFKFYCADLEHFRTSGTPALAQLGIGTYRVDGFRQNTKYVSLKPEVRHALIDGLGQSDTPTMIDFDYVELGDVDLSPLAKRKDLVDLRMTQAGITFNTLKSLKDADHIEHLSAKDLSVNASQLQWILAEFPNLQSLAVNLDNVDQGVGDTLSLAGAQHLKELELGNPGLLTVSQLQISNCPELRTSVLLGPWTQRVEIKNAAKLDTVILSGHAPRGLSLVNLPGLRTLALGGPGVTDTIVTNLAPSQRLAELTMAYPAISRQGMERLPITPSLSLLSLPGTPLDDELVLAWPELPSLRFLDVRDTNVTATALNRLLAKRTLTHVCLDRCPISPGHLGVISQQLYLKHLSLDGIGTESSILAKTLESSDDLRVLNLSNCKVSTAVFDVLAKQASSLRHLSLRDSQFDPKDLTMLLNSNRRLVIDTDIVALPTEVSQALLTSRRLQPYREWQARLRMEAQMRTMQQQGRVAWNRNAFASAYEIDTFPEHLDVAEFAPGGQFDASQSSAYSSQTGVTNAAGVPATRPPAGVMIGNMIGRLFGSLTKPGIAASEGEGASPDDNNQQDDEPKEENANEYVHPPR